MCFNCIKLIAIAFHVARYENFGLFCYAYNLFDKIEFIKLICNNSATCGLEYCRRDCAGPTEWDCENCAHFKVYNDSRVVDSSQTIQTYAAKANLSYSMGLQNVMNITSGEEGLILTSTEPQAKPVCMISSVQLR